MADRTSDWNALFDPETGAGELRRIVAAYPEFAAQARTHPNWSDAPLPPPPAYPPLVPPGPAIAPAPAAPFPVATPEPVPVTLAAMQRPARLTGVERAWWVIAGAAWVLVFAASALLRDLGGLDELMFSGTLGGDEFYIRSTLWALGVEAIVFVLAILAGLVAGRTPGRRVGSLVVLLVGYAVTAFIVWFTPVVVTTVFVSWGAMGVEIPAVAGLLFAFVTALPLAVEALAGSIGYALSVERRWHVLWVAPITLVLTFGGYFLVEPVAAALGPTGPIWAVLGFGVLIRLIAVVLIGVLGARRELTHPYSAPAYAPPAY